MRNVRTKPQSPDHLLFFKRALSAVLLLALPIRLFFSRQKSKNAVLSSQPIPICLARPSWSMINVRH
jgi:hypothetical protein